MLAEYLKYSYLSIDMYDADTRFLYGTTKLPLFELMRQGKEHISIAKEAEMCAPDTSEDRGSLKLIIGNQGHQMKVREYDQFEETKGQRNDKHGGHRTRTGG